MQHREKDHEYDPIHSIPLLFKCQTVSLEGEWDADIVAKTKSVKWPNWNGKSVARVINTDLSKDQILTFITVHLWSIDRSFMSSICYKTIHILTKIVLVLGLLEGRKRGMHHSELCYVKLGAFSLLKNSPNHFTILNNGDPVQLPATASSQVVRETGQ